MAAADIFASLGVSDDVALDAADPRPITLRCVPGQTVQIRPLTPDEMRGIRKQVGPEPIYGDLVRARVMTEQVAALSALRTRLEAGEDVAAAIQQESLEGRARRLHILRQSDPLAAEAVDASHEWHHAWAVAAAELGLVAVPAWQSRPGLETPNGDRTLTRRWFELLQVADAHLHWRLLDEIGGEVLKLGAISPPKGGPSGRPSGSPGGMKPGNQPTSSLPPDPPGTAPAARGR